MSVNPIPESARPLFEEMAKREDRVVERGFFRLSPDAIAMLRFMAAAAALAIREVVAWSIFHTWQERLPGVPAPILEGPIW
jgi:hypothetical protein